jgi:alpha-galactosidase
VCWLAGNGFGYGYKIDFTKPGAQAYINSIVNLYASWGIDYIKLDSVPAGSYHDDLTINNSPDVQAYSCTTAATLL